METCDLCGNPLTGRQTKFCSRSCNEKAQLHKNRVLLRKNTSGSNNPRWRGGHRHWSDGRWGADKNGLHWKTQRKLAWERDSYTCQHCGLKSTRKPDVHHIKPYRLSQSHALDNLVCLCKSCHTKEDAKIQESLGALSYIRRPTRNTCACGSNCLGEACSKCNRKERERVARSLREPKVKKLPWRKPKKPLKMCPVCGVGHRVVFDTGCQTCLTTFIVEHISSRTSREIALELGMTHTTVLNWLKVYKLTST